MRKVRIITMYIIASAILFGCNSVDFNGPGTGGGTTTTPPPNLTPTPITTSAEGAAASSLAIQSKELVVASTNLFKNLGFIAQSQMVSTVSGTGTGTCADYGTYDYTRTYNSNGTYSMSFTFSLCRENDFQYDGTYSATGTPASFVGRLNGLTILNFKNNYTTLIGSLVGSTLSFVMAGSGDAANAAYSFTANGGIAAFDYYSLGRHTMYFTQLVTSFSVTTNGVTNVRDTLMTTNGKYSVRRLTTTTAITYADFNVTHQKQLLTNIEDVSIVGRIVADRTPNAGFEGVFDVATAGLIRTLLSPYPPMTTQGTLVTNNTATIQYGAADSIDVDVAGDATITYAKEFMLLKVGDFYAMEQQLPLVSGITGTATGSVMSISALSTGPALNCYTDVHVSYFNTVSPVPATPINWYVHWSSGLSTCTPQANIPYQEATSSTGVTTDPCNVGLDINGASTDITSGGVEHFLAAALPTGYYVLSIDNYSCATTVVNDATILVGDYLFGPYNCTYSASDTDGSTLGAWCRLADIRVNAGGVIDILPPDTVNLVPWHP